MTRRRTLLASFVATLLGLGTIAATPAATQPLALIGEGAAPPPAYYRPVVLDGFTFPVARTNWFSPIDFSDDWHAPRNRVINGKWVAGAGFHEGNDIFAPKGTPIVAARGGQIEAVGWTFYSGLRIGVRGDDGRYYLYAHLSGVPPGITVGTPVPVGGLIGYMGNSGYGPPGTSGKFVSHVHFGIQDGSTWVNPVPFDQELYRASTLFTSRAERRLALLRLQGRFDEAETLAQALYVSWNTG